MLLTIPLNLVVSSYMARHFRDRKALVILIILCLISNAMMIDMFYASEVQYCIFFVLLIILLNLLESVSSTLFSKIIPSDYELYKFNAGFLVNVITSVGRVLGSGMLTFVGNL